MPSASVNSSLLGDLAPLKEDSQASSKSLLPTEPKKPQSRHYDPDENPLTRLERELEGKAISEIKKLYRRRSGVARLKLADSSSYDGGYRESYYARAASQNAVKLETDLFFTLNDDENLPGQKPKLRGSKTVGHTPEISSQRKAGFDTSKLNTILGQTLEDYKEDAHDAYVTKIQLLCALKADVVAPGAPPLHASLLVRTIYGKKTKLTLALIELLKTPEELDPPTVKKGFSWSKSPLFVACSQRDPDVVELLLHKQASPNRFNQYGSTPFVAACRKPITEEQGCYERQLRCLKLLATSEGPQWQALVTRTADDWMQLCPGVPLNTVAWRIVASFCIPPLNLGTTDKHGKTWEQHLEGCPQWVVKEGMAILGPLKPRKFRYWPQTAEECEKCLAPHWKT